MPSDTLPRPALSRRVLVVGILVLVATVYFPIVGFDLVYDDGWTLMSNGFLRQPQDLPLLFTRTSIEHHVPDAFRPTLVMFDMATYGAFGLSSPLHHLLSLVLHLAVTFALYVWLGRLGAPEPVRLVTSALFGVLAIHAEAVAVVSFREDLLAAGLGLSALGVMSHSSRSRLGEGVRLATGGMLQTLACGAKMSAAGLPLVWWLAVTRNPWQESMPRGRRWMRFAALGLASAVAVAHQVWLFGSPVPYGSDNLRLEVVRQGLSATLAESVRIHLGYLQQIAVPLGLSPEYVDRGASWTDPVIWLCAAALASLLAYGVWGTVSRKRPAMGLAIVGWFLLAIPTSNLFPMPNMRADRFMYLPSTALCLAMAVILLALGRHLSARSRRSIHRFVPAAIVVILQGAAAQASARVYQNDVRLWETALRKAPDSARAQSMATLLRVGAIERSRQQRAEVDPLLLARLRGHCVIAERLDPSYELPQLCFARLANAQQQWDEAYRRLQRALEVSPDRNDGILASLAEVALDRPLEGTQAQSLALSHLDRGLREYPYSADLVAAAARVYHRLGRPQEAVALYRRARILRPERWEIVAWGVELALDLGDAAAARRTWKQHAKLLQQTDPVLRHALQVRLARSSRLRLDHQEVFPSGVFPK